MVFDFDDHHPGNDAMPYMHRLKATRPDFKATLFCIPALADDDYWNSLPDWIEVVAHGWTHPHPREAEHWAYDQSVDVLLSLPERMRQTRGWKSPGWLTSPGMYRALDELGWWIADQHLADSIRPKTLDTYLWEDGFNVHGHVQDVCGNGLRETWPTLCEVVESATSFEFASEAVKICVSL